MVRAWRMVHGAWCTLHFYRNLMDETIGNFVHISQGFYNKDFTMRCKGFGQRGSRFYIDFKMILITDENELTQVFPRAWCKVHGAGWMMTVHAAWCKVQGAW
jgi:hypothetical protein